MLRFDGRVALVTGAGGGLGKSYALYLASRGAAVVVNDLGGSRSGDGQSSKAADVVVKEIQDKGGKAVANYDSVENGHLLVQTAIEKFGRIDVVINNAGILRDKSILKLSDDDWDLVHKVHLKGAFKVIQAAWPHMKKQNYGRIINTSSVAGLYGNFGQANYSAAKMGLVGLTKTCAIEGGKNNIFSNVIVPMAASRLTEDIFMPEMMEKLKPELIAPAVAWLCHENCQENGSIIESVGGWIGKYQLQRTQGSFLLPAGKTELSIDDVSSNWSKVVDFTNATSPERNEDALAEIMNGLSKQEVQKVNPVGKEVSLENAVGYTSPPFEYSYTSKDLILYALSIGVSLRDEDGLQFLYEGHDNFAAQPGFGTIPGFGGLSQLLTGAIPGLSIDLLKVLHGEQFIEIINPIPVTGTLVSHFKISAILDKGSGAVIILDILSKDKETGVDIIHNQTSVFVAGAGGFGGPRTSKLTIDPSPEMPKRNPDAVQDFKTDVDQAAFYRQNADLNPLHIDPGFAAMAGFQQPILHGLCSLGIAIRQVGSVFAKGNPGNIKSFKARFAKPVLPGQTITTKMWLENDKVQFESVVKETQTVCISGGWVKFNKAGSKGDEVNGSGSKTGELSESSNNFKLDSLKKEIFRCQVFKNNKPFIQWELNQKSGQQKVFHEMDQTDLIPTSKSHLEISNEDMEALLRGNLNPHSAAIQGKLQADGDFELVRQLTGVFGSISKM